ncbi:branched chain amino acid aminotransferase [Shimia sp. NS0008-38b]|uniref:sulfotransferase-like domain-containing protein n=1 Tax=Shimia sp. NS0008-38b TaxID=3127653 RepID=UPI0031079760
MKIAMWSGPRNLSTAMMYAFGNRSDCAVVDEPFYAAYLAMTGIDHPMRSEILASQDQDPKMVAAGLTDANPDGKTHYYQKHMTQHMIEGVPRDWMREVKNVFLLRHPARVIASYAAKRENPTLTDIGFPQQAELMQMVAGWGQTPVVVDSHDIRENPQDVLEKMCDAIGLDFHEAMLNWPKGGHKDDGVWARHWYGAVWNSTGFAGAEGPLPEVPDALQPVLEAALPLYEEMKARRI